MGLGGEFIELGPCENTTLILAQNPRKNVAGVKEAKLSPIMADRYCRAEAANDNGFTSLPLFAAAIVGSATSCLWAPADDLRSPETLPESSLKR